MQNATNNDSNVVPTKPRDTELALPNSLRWRVIILCAFVCVMDGFDMVVAPIGTPLMAADWNIALSNFSIALSAAVLGSGLGAAFIAPLGDRFGRRPLVLASFTLLGLSCLAMPLIDNVSEMMLLRFVTGLGMGASLANALALVSEFAHPHSRSRIVAGVYAMSAVGGALGGFISPLLIEQFGWQGIYVFGGGVPLLLLVFLFFGLPESRRFLLLKEQAAFIQSTRASASEDVAQPDGIKIMPSGVLNSLRTLFATQFRAATVLLWLLYVFSMFTTYMIIAWLPTLMTLSGWTMADSVHSVTAFSIGGIFGGLLLGWLVDQGRTRQALILGFAATAIALGLLWVVPAQVTVWLLLIVVMGAGTIGISYALAAVAAFIYPTTIRASGIGAAAAMGRVGATLAPVIGGWLLAKSFLPLQILTSLIVPMIVALLIVHYFSRRLDPPEK